MTSKEAYLKIQEFINDIQLGITRSSLDIVEPLNVIRNLTKQSHPTLSECIKEWNGKGFKYIRFSNSIKFENKSEDIIIIIQEWNESVMITDSNYCYARHIPYNLHNLIHKTLKALEEIKDE